MKRKLLIVFLIVLIPTFFRMLRPGIYSMHDFHAFRLHEFDQCIRDLQIPCRWSANSTFEYGQPLFNFYGQIVYIPSEIMHLVGFSNLASLKFAYILSLVLSGLAMYFTALHLWKSKMAGFVSGILYVYAPYRAVDVWVRGALPEATAFVFFPLIFLFFEKRKYLLLAFSLAGLLLVHNLSFLMFMALFIPWVLFRIKRHKIGKLFFVGVFTLGLSAFYILPVIFESKLVGLGGITGDYYNFKLHYTTLYQLFVSRLWGYGGSVWGPNDTMSFSVGHVQWILALILTGSAFVRRNYKLLLIVAVGWFALFLTHGKSEVFWEATPVLPFLQFPWRFLSIATFSFALAAGFVATKHRRFALVAVLIAVVMNVGYFREDVWQGVGDEEYFSGETWEWQTSSARGDFWPVYANKIPDSLAPGFFGLVKTSRSAKVKLTLEEESEVEFPIVYFDGWTGNVDIYPSGEYGLITTKLPAGSYDVDLEFKNTPIRNLGNVVSLVSLAFAGVLIKRGK